MIDYMQIGIKRWHSGAWILTADEISKYKNLSDAILNSGKSFQCADLQYADLQYADLLCANLRGANLLSVNLQFANLQYANLQFADLLCADLRGAKSKLNDIEYEITKTPIIIFNLRWSIYIDDKIMEIGCQKHFITDWFKFKTKEIAEIESNALSFWKENRKILLMLCKNHTGLEIK